MPGIRKYEVSQGPVTVLAGPPDVYPIGTVHFDSLAAMRQAFASPAVHVAMQAVPKDNTLTPPIVVVWRRTPRGCASEAAAIR